MSTFGYAMSNRRHRYKSGNFTPRNFFWVIPPCCLHLSSGEQVVEAATRDVNKIL
jgi:hypothetical protein